MKGKSPTRGKDLGCTVCSGPDTSGQEFPRLASHSNLRSHNGQADKVPIAGTPDSGLKDAAGENPSGPVAQWLEPTAHNGLVAGSSPAGPTTAFARAFGAQLQKRQLRRSLGAGGLAQHL